MPSESTALISVIIPAYNYAALLEDAIGSLMNQTYANWECIVVDDSSTDNTKEVVANLLRNEPRIQYFLQPKSGPTVARNFGLKKAKGQFIQFLDADDLLEPRKFEVQLDLFKKNPDVDLVYGKVKYFRAGNKSEQFDNITLEGSKPWMKKLSGSGDEMTIALLKENLMVIQSPLFKYELVKKFGAMDENLYYNEDWELWLRFAIGNAKFLFDETEGTNSLVRVHDSYSKDNYNMFVNGLIVSLKVSKVLTARKYRKILVPKIAYHQKIIDEKILAIARTDKEEAMIRAVSMFSSTNLPRYKVYTRLFMFFPVWFAYLYSKFIAVANKLKNIVLYA